MDYATSFQVVVSFYEKETSDVLRCIFREAWKR